MQNYLRANPIELHENASQMLGLLKATQISLPLQLTTAAYLQNIANKNVKQHTIPIICVFFLDIPIFRIHVGTIFFNTATTLYTPVWLYKLIRTITRFCLKELMPLLH